MNEISILLIIFSFLFLIEIKSINNLANYIGIVLSLAILISLLYPNLTYISFILILIQISALTILFGLIIMLFPNNHTIPFPSSTIPTTNKLSFNKWIIAIISLIAPLFLLFNLTNTNTEVIDPESLKSINNIWLNSINNLRIEDQTNWTNSFINNNNNILFKIAQSFYTDSSIIIKFLFITFLLFFAIVALFFLVLPTNSL